MPKGSISHNHEFVRKLINGLFIAFSGGKNRAPILKSSDAFPQSKVIEDNFSMVQEEIFSLLENRSLTRYKDIDPHRATEVSMNWQLYYIMMLGELNEIAKKECPNIVTLIRNLKDINNVTIAVLEPGVGLASHEGPYAGILRYHLGIKVPENNPPYIRVHDQTHVWQVGKSIVIDDVFDHEVINESDDTRVILMIDFMRPMNVFLHQVNKISLFLKRKWAKHLITKANG